MIVLWAAVSFTVAYLITSKLQGPAEANGEKDVKSHSAVTDKSISAAVDKDRATDFQSEVEEETQKAAGHDNKEAAETATESGLVVSSPNEAAKEPTAAEFEPISKGSPAQAETAATAPSGGNQTSTQDSHDIAPGTDSPTLAAQDAQVAQVDTPASLPPCARFGCQCYLESTTPPLEPDSSTPNETGPRTSEEESLSASVDCDQSTSVKQPLAAPLVVSTNSQPITNLATSTTPVDPASAAPPQVARPESFAPPVAVPVAQAVPMRTVSPVAEPLSPVQVTEAVPRSGVSSFLSSEAASIVARLQPADPLSSTSAEKSTVSPAPFQSLSAVVTTLVDGPKASPMYHVPAAPPAASRSPSALVTTLVDSPKASPVHHVPATPVPARTPHAPSIVPLPTPKKVLSSTATEPLAPSIVPLPTPKTILCTRATDRPTPAAAILADEHHALKVDTSRLTPSFPLPRFVSYSPPPSLDFVVCSDEADTSVSPVDPLSAIAIPAILPSAWHEPLSPSVIRATPPRAARLSPLIFNSTPARPPRVDPPVWSSPVATRPLAVAESATAKGVRAPVSSSAVTQAMMLMFNASPAMPAQTVECVSVAADLADVNGDAESVHDSSASSVDDLASTPPGSARGEFSSDAYAGLEDADDYLSNNGSITPPAASNKGIKTASTGEEKDRTLQKKKKSIKAHFSTIRRKLSATFA